MKKIFLYIFCATFFFACNSQKTSTRDISVVNTPTIPDDTLKELLSITGVPDSVLTTKQLEIKKKLNMFLKEYLKVENNHFVLQADSQDFVESGLSNYYFDILKKDIKVFNNFVDSEGILNLEEKFKNGSIEKGFILYSSEKDR